MSASRDGPSEATPGPPPKKRSRIGSDESLVVEHVKAAQDNSMLEDLADAENVETREAQRTATWTNEQLRCVFAFRCSPQGPGCVPSLSPFNFPHAN